MAPKPRQQAALNPKQQAFVAEYLVDLNGKQAAIRAGYSPKTAEVQASRLLSLAKVAAAVAEGKAARLERVQVTADDVLRMAWEAASFDLGECFDEQGKLKSMKAMPEGARRLLMAVETIESFRGDDEEPEIVHKIKLPDRLKALELVGKHVDIKAFDTSVQLELPPKVIRNFTGRKK